MTTLSIEARNFLKDGILADSPKTGFSSIWSEINELIAQLVRKINVRYISSDANIQWVLEESSVEFGNHQPTYEYVIRLTCEAHTIAGIRLFIDPEGDSIIEGPSVEIDRLPAELKERLSGFISSAAFKRYFQAYSDYSEGTFLNLKAVFSKQQLTSRYLLDSMTHTISNMKGLVDIICENHRTSQR